MVENGLEVRKVPGKGRGLFAARPVQEGELLLTCPTVELSPTDCERFAATSFHKHYFTHPAVEGGGLIALGLLTLVNHSPTPNTDWTYRDDPAAGWVIELWSLKRIAPGEEITIDYNTPLWFEAS